MSEITWPPAAHNSKGTFLGSPARAAYLLVAGAALLVGLTGRPAGQTVTQPPLLEAPVAQHRSVEPVAAQPVAPAVVVIDGAAPVVPIAPAVASEPARDGVSDRDGWGRDPGARVARPSRVVLVQPAAVKVVPETPAVLRAPIARTAARYGLPSDVLSAALARESANFKDKYVYGYHVDGTGRGIAGIDKQYHPEVSDAQALDPEFAIDWMGRYLSGIVRKNGGDVYSALREYNGGPNFASDRKGYEGRTVSELTRTHADSIMAHAARAILA